MAETMWHYSRAGQQYGPIPEEQLKQLIAQGQLGPSDLVWRDGMPNWAMVQQMPELGVAAGSGYVPPPPGYEAAAPVVGYYSPGYGVPQYAGFWLRFVAYIIDGLVITAISCCGIGGVLGGLIQLFRLEDDPITAIVINLVITAAVWLYYALMESSSKQATLGKMAMGLYVTDAQGRRISFARATGRFFGKWLSGLILSIGFIMAAFTERKQALHDLLADTLVMRR